MFQGSSRLESMRMGVRQAILLTMLALIFWVTHLATFEAARGDALLPAFPQLVDWWFGIGTPLPFEH